MSAVMYKQRFNQPTYSSTPNKNAEHIRYIGTRPGVMKNEGQKHGLFGNIYNPDTLEVNTKINDVMELVRRKSYEKKNIFKAVISFNLENAALKVGNPVTKEAWEELIKQQLRIIAEGNNIKMSNLKWVAAAHDTPDHPHVHIVFWDESQEIIKNFVKSQVPNGIRTKLVKNIFEAELKEFHEERDHCIRLMKDITDGMVREFEDFLKNMSVTEYKNLRDNPYAFDEDMSVPEFLAARLYDLRKDIPKGSLKFGYLNGDVKNKAVLLVRDLIDIDEELQEAVQAYVDVKLKEAGLYQDISKNLDALTDKYMREAEVKIANSILKYISKFSQKEWEVLSHDRKVYHAQQLLNEIFKILGRNSRNKNQSGSRKHIMGGGLSKQARKEKAKELSDTGWDMDK